VVSVFLLKLIVMANQAHTWWYNRAPFTKVLNGAINNIDTIPVVASFVEQPAYFMVEWSETIAPLFHIIKNESGLKKGGIMQHQR